MIPFLKSVARGYVEHYSDLKDFCFVFPNKRAGTFFLKYLSQEYERFTPAPRVTTITDFVTDLSGRIVDNRLDLLFLLHECYCQVVAPGVAPENRVDALSFDAFRLWGETVLHDFDEVDMQDVNPDEIFSNLKDFREISSNYLNEEQKKVIEEYFGYNVEADNGEFWKKFENTHRPEGSHPGDGRPDARPGEKFLQLWMVLKELYHKFHEALASEGLTTPGGAYLLALRNIEEDDANAIKLKEKYSKLVFVGFNALSRTEREIFKALYNMESEKTPCEGEPFADFVWDATGPVLRDHENPAGRFVAVNRKRLPEPEWLRPYLRESDVNGFPEKMRVVASPSNVLQTKIGGEEVARLLQDIGDEAFSDARVAMVLPDETLLLPLLYSMPENLGNPNLTMGYPLKMTSVATFVTLLRNMQMCQRVSGMRRGFSYPEMKRVLAHPLAHAILGTSAIHHFRGAIEESHRMIVYMDDIAQLLPRAKEIFKPIDMKAPHEEVFGYLENVLSQIERSMAEGGNRLLRRRLEYTHAQTWREALAQLADTVNRRGVRLSAGTLFIEADRLLAAETVPFEGEPLVGLQVMGMLETRSLDFDHIVVLSLNDRIMPGRHRQRTFLPDTLRRGYGMPPANHQEDIFAYHFYRLISRAKSVTMVYDARIGINSGGPSRYLRQLDYLYKESNLKHEERALKVTQESFESQEAEKSRHVLDKLALYNAPRGKRHYSASSLKKYCVCPLKFYLESVEYFGTDGDVEPYVSPIIKGQVVHSVMEHLYVPDESMRGKWLGDAPVRITADAIAAMMEDEARIEGMIRRGINDLHFRLPEEERDTPLPPAANIIAQDMLRQVLDILRHDMETLGDFEILGCEVKENVAYSYADGKSVNMKFVIDRIDRVKDPHTGEEHVRILDYKTGKVYQGKKGEEPTFEDIFVNMDGQNPTFQMFFYAEMLNRWLKEQGKPTLENVETVVYCIDTLGKDGEVHPILDGETVMRYSDVSETFTERLDAMLEEIYDPATPFYPRENQDKNCEWCHFSTVCKRKAL